MSEIAIERDGTSAWLTGGTYPYRDQIKAAGGKWEAGKGWKIAETALAELTPAFATAPVATAEAPAGIDESDRVIRGRAKYKGKEYYLLFDGNKKDGSGKCARLASRDGKITFWVKDIIGLEIVKRYTQPTSIGALRAYSDARRKEASGEAECPVCSRECRCDTGFCSHHHDGCDRCGAES